MAERRKREIWHPPTYDKEDIRAVQAIVRYAAEQTDVPPSARDCKRAMDWIVHNAAGTYEECFVPDNPSVRDYTLGRRSVGLAIVKLMKLKPEPLHDPRK